MTDPKGTEEQIADSIFKGISVYQNFSGDIKCYSTSENTSATQDLGTLGWDFQVCHLTNSPVPILAATLKACTEMVMPMCNNGTDMFEVSEWNLETYSNDCEAKFGVRPRPYWATTEFWGDKLASATNIIFR